MEAVLSDYICNDCPRKCNVKRTFAEQEPFTEQETISQKCTVSKSANNGFCGASGLMRVVRAAPHFGEEPCISGTRGSGAVFFEGCNLRCVFCQNFEISRMRTGIATKAAAETCSAQIRDPSRLYTPEGLREVLLRLRDTGVHNINLVTPTHYTRQIAAALDGLELGIPMVWNSSGYESVESLKRLEGLVQIYMPDYKYASRILAKKYSAAEDYPERAAEALQEMVRQTGPYRMNSEGLLQSGVLVRHLVLPANLENSMDVIDFIADTFAPGTVLFSLMSQYTPMPAAARFPELRERVTQETMEILKHYMQTRHLEDGYYQDVESATVEMIPQWDGTGLV